MVTWATFGRILLILVLMATGYYLNPLIATKTSVFLFWELLRECCLNCIYHSKGNLLGHRRQMVLMSRIFDVKVKHGDPKANNKMYRCCSNHYSLTIPFSPKATAGLWILQKKKITCIKSMMQNLCIEHIVSYYVVESTNDYFFQLRSSWA